MKDIKWLLKEKANLETVMQRGLETSVRAFAQQELDKVCKQIKEACEEWDRLFEQQEINQLKQRVSELEAINKEILGALEDFVIAIEGYFNYRETDDIQPEDDVAYFIGEYRTAKNLIKKARGQEDE